jgi:hypothetical protein
MFTHRAAPPIIDPTTPSAMLIHRTGANIRSMPEVIARAQVNARIERSDLRLGEHIISLLYLFWKVKLVQGNPRPV